MMISDKWYRNELMEGDNESPHRHLNEEYSFYHAVKSGDMASVQMNCLQKRFSASDGMGTLSANPVTNIKYHFVIAAAMMARHCIDNGMEHNLSFRLSDFYIQKLDSIQTVEEVVKLHDEMSLDYTSRMHQLQKERIISKAIVMCTEYIYNHLHDRITVNTLAAETELSPSYLSRLFKKEMGVSVSDFIREKKIERAQNLLKYSDFSLIEISNYLAFSSQSHFIQTFEKQVGMTPKKYRDQFYRSMW